MAYIYEYLEHVYNTIDDYLKKKIGYFTILMCENIYLKFVAKLGIVQIFAIFTR